MKLQFVFFSFLLLWSPLLSGATPQWSLISLPVKNLMSLSGARNGEEIFLSGDRSFIFRSKNSGRNWESLSIPYNGLTTKLLYLSDGSLLIGGHEASILRKSFGSDDFSLVHQRPESDQPILSFLEVSQDRLMAFGAYGLILESSDLGKTWGESSLYVEEEPHLYASLQSASQKILAGEFGQILIVESDDQLKNVPVDYSGSLFFLKPWGSRIWTGGLQSYLASFGANQSVDSTLFSSDDDRAVYGLHPLDEERALVFGANGLLKELHLKTREQIDRSLSNRASITDVLELGNGDFILLGPQALKLNLRAQSN